MEERGEIGHPVNARNKTDTTSARPRRVAECLADGSATSARHEEIIMTMDPAGRPGPGSKGLPGGPGRREVTVGAAAAAAFPT